MAVRKAERMGWEWGTEDGTEWNLASITSSTCDNTNTQKDKMRAEIFSSLPDYDFDNRLSITLITACEVAQPCGPSGGGGLFVYVALLFGSCILESWFFVNVSWLHNCSVPDTNTVQGISLAGLLCVGNFLTRKSRIVFGDLCASCKRCAYAGVHRLVRPGCNYICKQTCFFFVYENETMVPDAEFRCFMCRFLEWVICSGW